MTTQDHKAALLQLADRIERADERFPLAINKDAAVAIREFLATPPAPAEPQGEADTGNLRKLLEKATPGPWIAIGSAGYVQAGHGHPKHTILAVAYGHDGNHQINAPGSRENGEYIAACNPASIRSILDELDVLRAERSLRTAPPPQQPAQGWQPIETVSEGNLVVVYWEDPTDPANPERYDFDYLEDGTWMNHHDRYEHMCIAGGHGLKEAAPYTHWMALGTPAMTAAQDAAQGGGNG